MVRGCHPDAARLRLAPVQEPAQASAERQQVLVILAGQLTRHRSPPGRDPRTRRHPPIPNPWAGTAIIAASHRAGLQGTNIAISVNYIVIRYKCEVLPAAPRG